MAIPPSLDPPANYEGKAFEQRVRTNLRTFHKSLNLGNFSKIATLIAPDYYWNYDGTVILTRKASAAALEIFVTSSLKGMAAQDIYNIVDGNKAAVLFRITGRQSGPFVGLPMQTNGRFDVLSGEFFHYNNDALARHVVTVTPVGLVKDQMRGVTALPVPHNRTLKHALEMKPLYVGSVRQKLASIHLSANAGTTDRIAGLATRDVEVINNGAVSHGQEAFSRVVLAQDAGKGSFPNKLFHDLEVLVDGSFAAIDYVWQASQTSRYASVQLVEGAVVRVRGMLFFELNEKELITKITHVYDESVVLSTLQGTTSYLYP